MATEQSAVPVNAVRAPRLSPEDRAAAIEKGIEFLELLKQHSDIVRDQEIPAAEKIAFSAKVDQATGADKPVGRQAVITMEGDFKAVVDDFDLKGIELLVQKKGAYRGPEATATARLLYHNQNAMHRTDTGVEGLAVLDSAKKSQIVYMSVDKLAENLRASRAPDFMVAALRAVTVHTQKRLQVYGFNKMHQAANGMGA